MKYLILLLLVTLTSCGGTNQTTYNRPTPKEIIYIGLDELDIQGVVVNILPIPEFLKESRNFDNTSLDAFIIGSGDRYLLRIDKLTPSKTITVIAHELIHLTQLRSGKLKVISGNTVEWEGVTYENISRVTYERRPWEREAFTKGRDLEFKIIEKLNR